MDFPVGMEDPYGYEQQWGLSNEYYNSDHGGSYYDPNCSEFSYDAQDFCSDNPSELCAGMEDQPRSTWENLLEICIAEVFEHRNVTNQRLENLERNTTTLERGLATLVAQVEMLEINLGIIATTIGSRHTPGTLPSLPEINPRGGCHAIQLRSGTTYQPPEAGDLGMRRREAEKPPGNESDEAVRRSAAPQHGGPPSIPQQVEENLGLATGGSPATATPHRGGPPAG